MREASSRIHRFFVPPGAVERGHVSLSDAQMHQIRHVLRLQEGERVVAFDGDSHEYVVELSLVGREGVRASVVAEHRSSNEPLTRLVLCQSLLKGDKFELVLQKCTELGVAKFVPVSSERVVASDVSISRRKRWERIVIEAAEQAGRSKIPTISPVQTLGEALEGAASRGGIRLIPWEEEHVCDLHKALHRIDADASIHLFVGPEGGFSTEEVDQARALGAQPVTLGSRILRAETAALVAAAAIFFEQGELDARKEQE